MRKKIETNKNDYIYNHRVRFSETDQMGIVYHGNYFSWFENCRDEMFRKIGYSYFDVEELSIQMPVVSCHCDYINAVKYDDEILVIGHIKSFKRTKLMMKYNVWDASKKNLIAKAEVSYTFTDKELQLINISKKLPQIYEILVEMSELKTI